MLTAYTRVKKPPPSGSARKNLTKRGSWLLDKLKFLSPFVATRVPISNIVTDDSNSPSCITIADEVDGQNDDDDDSFNDPAKPSNSFKNEVDCPISSTKQPTRIKPNRKRQADEEYDLMTCLAKNISRKRSREMAHKICNNPDEAFGHYIMQSLSELPPTVRHLAQYKINEILFQAQSGELTHQSTRVPVAMHQHMFQTPYAQNNMHPISNHMTNSYRYNTSSPIDGGLSRPVVNIWSSPISRELNSGQDTSAYDNMSS
ncbi:uncharacterized protein LOC124433865 [Xenia sp. Carnegie-2017]|uniref:uncharacterized protein LOC124433865 n=1 Tax=Xenia sp. Carnegie-2017 TaxID=2897299 RepID=UPI001F0478C7|nr:uncharacterized protein LOC124433865 [Xenia sp. Carnegie-2017]